MLVVHTLESLQETFEARASEWALTGAVLSLAAIFFLNGEMFYGESLYGIRNMINDRFIWAWLFLSVGVVRLAVLLVNGAYWRTPHFRALTAFLCTGVWFLLLIGFMKSGSILAAIMPWVFFLDAYNVKRASLEAGKSEFVQRRVKTNTDRMNAGLAPKPHP